MKCPECGEGTLELKPVCVSSKADIKRLTASARRHRGFTDENIADFADYRDMYVCDNCGEVFNELPDEVSDDE